MHFKITAGIMPQFTNYVNNKRQHHTRLTKVAYLQQTAHATEVFAL